MTDHLTIFNFAQAAIVIFGVPAVFMSQSLDPASRKWAPVLGLIGQPAWAYTAYATSSYGIGIICVLYTVSWYRGFHNMWVVPIRNAIKLHEALHRDSDKTHDQ